MVIAGGVLMATGVGGPLGGMLIGAGADTIIQRATTGQVNYGQVAISGLLGAAGGGAASALLKGGGRLATELGATGLRTAITTGAASGTASGAGGSGYGYLTGPGPHTVSGFLTSTATGAVEGGLLGAAGGAAGHGLSTTAKNTLADLKPAPAIPVLPDNLADTFSGSRYTTSILPEETILYRAGSTSGSPLGQFFSPEPPIGVIQTRIDKAIPHTWPNGQPAPLDTGFAVRFPAGTIVHTGTVANQGDLFMGGTEQIVIQRPWDIPGVEVVNQWALK